MRVQALDRLRRQAAAVAHRHVALDVADRAHAGDDRRDLGEGEHVAQRGLGELPALDAQVLDDRLHVLLDLLRAVAPEVARAEVALRERAVGRDRSRQAALVERDAHDHADVALAHRGVQLVLRALVEHVVDHLHGVDPAGAHQLQRGVRPVVVDRHAEGADLALLLERLDGLEPIALLQPGVVPDVELLHVDDVEPEVAQAGLRAGADVLAGERLARVGGGVARPLHRLGRELGGDVDLLRPRAHDLADEPLGVPVAVAERRVDEVQPEVDGPVQRAQRFVVVGADPHRLADAPRAVADLGDLEAGPAQSSIVHAAPLPA